MLTRKSSKSRTDPPGSFRPLNTLNPSTQGMDKMMMTTRLTATAFFRLQPGEIHGKGQNVFKHCNNCRKCCERHKQEEQASPETSAAHGIEYIGQGNENQVRAAVRLDIVGKAGRENDKACHQGYQSIQNADA